MRIYISGPITGHPDYLDKFIRQESRLVTKGFEVVNPAKVGKMLPESVPYENIMQMCLTLIDMCDVIYMMSGFEKSSGANLELRYAIEQHKSVIFEGGAWENWLK